MPEHSDWTRRDFLHTAATTSAGGALAGGVRQDPERAPQDPLDAPLPRRALGRTGLQVSQLGLGTAPLGTLPEDRDEEAVAVIRRALDLGVNYLDTAPSYTRHRAEQRIGKALQGRKREEVVISTKSYELPKARALAELESSLRALRTDHVDVFQIHSIKDDADRERKLDPETGILAAALAAREAGKCRFIGVTGHARPDVMARCLEDFDFDTILMPVNCADPLWVSFVKETLPAAVERGTGVIAMKVFAAGRLVGGEQARASLEDCVRYALSQPISTAIVGAKSRAELEGDLRVAKAFEPLTAEQQTALGESLGEHPGNELEWYKRPKPDDDD